MSLKNINGACLSGLHQTFYKLILTQTWVRNCANSKLSGGGASNVYGSHTESGQMELQHNGTAAPSNYMRYP